MMMAAVLPDLKSFNWWQASSLSITAKVAHQMARCCIQELCVDGKGPYSEYSGRVYSTGLPPDMSCRAPLWGRVGWQALLMVLFGIWAIIFSFIDFNHFTSPVTNPTVYFWSAPHARRLAPPPYWVLTSVIVRSHLAGEIVLARLVTHVH
jgi:hypothetical protein